MVVHGNQETLTIDQWWLNSMFLAFSSLSVECIKDSAVL